MVLFQFTIFAQPPQAVTYLRVVNPATNPVLTHTDDFTKNHVVLPHPEEDGYMMCMAAHVNTSMGFIWAIRLISVDANNTFLWSRDITLTNQYSQNDVHSTTPFAMCYNNNNDGFVIAGIYDPELPNPNSLTHDKINHAFYISVDLGGNVTSMYATTSIQSGIGYAPLTITPTGNGYITGGLLHNNLLYPTNETCGYISEIGNNFVEIRGNRIYSSFVPQPSLPPNNPLNHDHRFDVVNNIKKTQTGHYVISGTTTTDLFSVLNNSTPSYYSQVAGSHDGFIAYLAPNWDVIWSKNFHTFKTIDPWAQSGSGATTIMDFTIDENNNYIYAIANDVRTSSTSGFTHGYVFKIDLFTGAVHSQITSDVHSNYASNFYSQIFHDEDYVYILGFAWDGQGNIPYNATPYPALHPICKVREIGTLESTSLSFIINGKNAGYRAHSLLYEGHLNITFESTNQTKPAHPLYPAHGNTFYVNHQINNHLSGPFNDLPYEYAQPSFNSPMVYHPKSWYLTNSGKLHCVNLKNVEFTGPIPGSFGTPNITYVSSFNYHPTLYVDIFNNDECFDKYEEIIDSLHVFKLFDFTLISITNSKLIENQMLTDFSDNFMIEMSECFFEGQLPESRAKANENELFNVYSKNQSVYFNPIILLKTKLEKQDVNAYSNVNVKLYDMAGKEIFTGNTLTNKILKTEKLQKGMYIYIISDSNGSVTQTNKVLVF